MSTTKNCASCGRPLENQSALLKNPDLKYCSGRCRRQKLDKNDVSLEDFLLRRLDELGATNICPSQITREYFGENWRSEHQRVVSASRRLMNRGKVEILQKNKKVSSMNFKGPIRLRRRK